MTPAEQFFLEQVNRARLDPLAEAARYGIDLNTNITGMTLTGEARQPLAPSALLKDASHRHSLDYLTGQVFDGHTGSDGSTPVARAADAGYPSGFVGENVGARFATNPLNADDAMTQSAPGSSNHHEGLFLSPGHRVNLLQSDYREIGVAQELGPIPSEFVALVADDPSLTDWDWFASAVTVKMGAVPGSTYFLTGVAYVDTDGDGAYSIGEGRDGVAVSVGDVSVASAFAGGYAIAWPAAQIEVSFDWEGTMLSAQVDLSEGNVKLDLVGGLRLMSSGDLVLGEGVLEAGLLGAADLSLTGNGLDNLLLVGRGNNVIDGGGGHNTALFSGMQADYDIAIEAGTITVADLRTDTTAQGTNTLTGVQTLRFSDGDLPGLDGPDPDPDPDPLPGPGTGPHTLAGTITDAGGAALGGTVVHLTHDGADAPAHAFTTGVDGSFALHPDAATGGRLDAMRAHDPVADGRPTVFDALDVLRLAVGLEPSFGPATPEAFIAADMDGNGQIDVFDALEVLRAAVGLDSAHGPRWIFMDSASLPEMDRTSVDHDPGIAIADLDADMTGLELTGILTGLMSEFG
ncbi:MAG: hypothetical protein JJU42_06480 [Rhodobacteraceae bacterium]|nr:hypothetical protein [Paracoccaceae bacterium]